MNWLQIGFAISYHLFSFFNTMHKLNLFLYFYLVISASCKPVVEPKVSISPIHEVATTDTFGLNYIMGKFEPANHPDFVTIPSKYRDALALDDVTLELPAGKMLGVAADDRALPLKKACDWSLGRLLAILKARNKFGKKNGWVLPF